MKELIIRDSRNGSWFWVNTAINSCPHLSAIDKVVYGALCTLAGYNEIHPSYEEISRRCAISVRRCKESVQNLIKQVVIKVERGGGKGNANVYHLLKVPKGCVLCTVSESNGADYDTQRVRITTAKGADCAPHIDIYKDKDIYIGDDKSSRDKTTFNPLGAEIIKAFELVDPKCKKYYGNKTQRSAADFLIKEYGLELVMERIALLPKTNKMAYLPTITSPYMLLEKWVVLESGIHKKKNQVEEKIISKGRGLA